MYQLTQNGSITRIAEGACIPPDPANSDYQAYLQWVAAGNVPLPAPVVPVAIPRAVTMRQARLALLSLGKLAAVTAAINSLPSPQKEAAQIEWEYSQEVQRHNGFVSQLAPVLGMDSAALDALFIAAQKL